MHKIVHVVILEMKEDKSLDAFHPIAHNLKIEVAVISCSFIVSLQQHFF